MVGPGPLGRSTDEDSTGESRTDTDVQEILELAKALVAFLLLHEEIMKGGFGMRRRRHTTEAALSKGVPSESRSGHGERWNS